MNRQRITQQEENLNSVTAALETMEQALEDFERACQAMEQLSSYYGSAAWHEDRAALDSGAFGQHPPAAGVLSEDAAYNAISDWRETYLQMLELASRAARI
ncbi:DUF4298 domain-containing protein [Rothia nasimurium]|uniref:DUF4298 domain-containing protein n=1 Tax=Rothia nasimurium TaxID=85336 RepID=UPI00360624CD